MSAVWRKKCARSDQSCADLRAFAHFTNIESTSSLCTAGRPGTGKEGMKRTEQEEVGRCCCAAPRAARQSRGPTLRSLTSFTSFTQLSSAHLSSAKPKGRAGRACRLSWGRDRDRNRGQGQAGPGCAAAPRAARQSRGRTAHFVHFVHFTSFTSFTQLSSAPLHSGRALGEPEGSPSPLTGCSRLSQPSHRELSSACGFTSQASLTSLTSLTSFTSLTSRAHSLISSSTGSPSPLTGSGRKGKGQEEPGRWSRQRSAAQRSDQPAGVSRVADAG